MAARTIEFSHVFCPNATIFDKIESCQTAHAHCYFQIKIQRLTVERDTAKQIISQQQILMCLYYHRMIASLPLKVRIKRKSIVNCLKTEKNSSSSFLFSTLSMWGYSEAALGLNLGTQYTRTIIYGFCNTTSFILG